MKHIQTPDAVGLILQTGCTLRHRPYLTSSYSLHTNFQAYSMGGDTLPMVLLSVLREVALLAPSIANRIWAHRPRSAKRAVPYKRCWVEDNLWPPQRGNGQRPRISPACVSWMTFVSFNLIGHMSFGENFVYLDQVDYVPFVQGISAIASELNFNQMCKYWGVWEFASISLPRDS